MEGYSTNTADFTPKFAPFLGMVKQHPSLVCSS